MKSGIVVDSKVAFVTGGAQRIGAAVVRELHAQGMDVVFQYRSSRDSALSLCEELGSRRPGSINAIEADLLETGAIPELIEKVVAIHGKLHVVVNNASSFYPTPLSTLSEEDWDDLMGTNAKAPLFIARAAAPFLAPRAYAQSGSAGSCGHDVRGEEIGADTDADQEGCIINIADIYGMRPLTDHPIYCATKAALIMLTKSLARDLGPAIRVNAIAPGAIMWPNQGVDESRARALIQRTPLQRLGAPQDIARTVLFLIRDATYLTGNVLVVDGGRSMLD